MWLFLETIDTWFKSCRWLLGLKLLPLFVKILEELKYFAFDALFYCECFQNSRNDPRSFQKLSWQYLIINTALMQVTEYW